jgi:hypothetical protein
MTGGPLDWIDGELAVLEAAGLRRELGVRRGPQQVRIEIDGQRYLNFASNDYLGLAANALADSVGAAVRDCWGSGASPLITGRAALHAELESQLAAFEARKRLYCLAPAMRPTSAPSARWLGRGMPFSAMPRTTRASSMAAAYPERKCSFIRIAMWRRWPSYCESACAGAG